MKFSSLHRGLSFFNRRIILPTFTEKTPAEYPHLSDLFSNEQLDQQGETMARQHQLDHRPAQEKLLTRLTSNERILTQTHALICEGEIAGLTLYPAAVWLLDNFFLIKEQILIAREHLPKSYSRELPRLRSGLPAGLPRVYEIVRNLISHVDGRVDEENLRTIFAAYQRVVPLNLGELWAIPIMLRLALLENLGHIAARIALGQHDRDIADIWAVRMLATAERDPKNIVIDIADMARADIPMSSTCVAELVRKLQSRNPALALAITWIEQRLSEQGQTIERQVQLDGQQQATNHIAIGNSITSLRFLTSIDWKEFVEGMSRVEQILRTEPAGLYHGYDFATRDACRHAVEMIARKSRTAEESVAQRAVAMAREAPHGTKGAHVGAWLIGTGRPALERAAGMRHTIANRLDRANDDARLALYLGSVLAVTGGMTAIAMSMIHGAGTAMLWAAGTLTFIACSQAGVALVNWMAAILARPRLLPKMDFIGGIPDTACTLITVPSMLSGEHTIAELLHKMETSYLSNKGSNLYFSLLTDFADAPKQTMPTDIALLESAQRGIRRLNETYGKNGQGPFLLFWRQREWNERERCWMGYERKRGKLEALNRFLRSTTQCGLTVEGSFAANTVIQYVLTLDTDTELPRDCARRLIETMAHPLNTPVFDQTKGCVTQGYTILQPRVASSLPAIQASHYSRLFGSESGIDPYTRAVSDTYQDLFGEGSFIGKGIYNVDMFVTAMTDRLPENRILSHDLLEGNYCRSGLVTDVQMVDTFPQSYREDHTRRIRWIRGDWQIATWLMRRVPGFQKKSVRNPLSLLSQWKILDNLRRSIVPVVMLLLIVGCWVFVSPPWLGLAVVAAILLLPGIPALLIKATAIPHRFPLSVHVGSVAEGAAIDLFRAFFTLAVLPSEAFSQFDAILRTCWRVMITRRHLLQWTVSGTKIQTRCQSVLGNFLHMGTAVLFAVLLCAFFFLGSWPFAGLLLAVWACSPLLTWWISRPLPPRPLRLSAKQTDFLRKTARKTWRYFEVFAAAQDNWLPADNFQEEPGNVVAHRTSPTNIGLLLLSNLGACDLGYIGAGQLIDRTIKTFKSMNSLLRFRGHFLNWYDTRTLQPLLPQYVSTVDSGNLAAYLLTLKAGLLGLKDQPVFLHQAYEGLLGTLDALNEAVVATTDKNPETIQHIQALGALLRTCRDTPTGLFAAMLNIERIIEQSNRLNIVTSDHSDTEVRWWHRALQEQAAVLRADMLLLAPWLCVSNTLGIDPTLKRELDTNRTLGQMALLHHTLHAAAFDMAKTTLARPDALARQIEQGALYARQRMEEIDVLAAQCSSFANQDYEFLYDNSRNLLVIGYDVGKHRCDDGYFDLLASESCLGSFIAIAQGKLPVEHWFRLGRLVAIRQGKMVLISWGGSMFEYLMPRLVMPGYERTLLGQSCTTAVEWQMEYGRKRGVPWGISESAENTTDANLNYQYRSFGVPGMGFKRELADDLVIAPYASALALTVKPQEACENMERMQASGYAGRYGMYEAIDFTPGRLGADKLPVLIKSFMAHHQGMTFVSLVNFLDGNPMVRRFESDPLFKATTLLLQERVPKVSPFKMEPSQVIVPHAEKPGQENLLRIFSTPHTTQPEVHLLSNGRYHVMVSNSGGGYSRWHNLAVTRWNEDQTMDNWGTFVYINDISTERQWSAAFHPVCTESRLYEAIFSLARAEFRRRDGGLDTYTEIAVSPEDDIEYRRITISNFTGKPRMIELTSYAEVSLAAPEADAAHPAFSNLFVQTQIIQPRRAILCTRRPRSPEETCPWMFHLFTLRGLEQYELSYETDRLAFIGRGRTTRNPAAMATNGPLGGAQGAVLDPIVSIRCRFTLKAGESVTAGFITGIAQTRAQAELLIDKYQDHQLADRVFDLAAIHGKVLLQQINTTEADAQLYGNIASSILYASRHRRADPTFLLKNTRGQSGLWAYGISGDLPIVLLRIGDPSKIEIAIQLLQAHAYWRSKGLAVDLIIWNEERTGYRQVFNEQLIGLITAGPEAALFDKPGGVFLRHPDQMSDEDQVLMQAAARVVLTDGGGTLADQIQRHFPSETPVPKFTATQRSRIPPSPQEFGQDNLLFFNGWGGFTRDGKEYVIQIRPGAPTPMPWVNVVANRHMGTVISTGGGYTWFENAHEFRITPWYNDAVCDRSGEAFYLRDEETGRFWSVTPQPAPGEGTYRNRHGFGYSVFEYSQHQLNSELWIYVDIETPVKFWMLKVRNDSTAVRRVSATGFLELVLGENRSKTQMHVRTGVDSKTGALLASNPYNTEFAGRVMFFEVNGDDRSICGDRGEFIGRNGSLANPAALHNAKLSGKVGVGLDPAAALQVTYTLEPGQEKEIVFILGVGKDIEDTRSLIQRFHGVQPAYDARDRVWRYWGRLLGAVHIETPDPALDVLTNGWLLYQTVSARIWSRSGFYQSGGAFGFRDQLQDVMALMHAAPDVVREHLLLCASRQFAEGDVQHWWHPPQGRGVRTMISDDYLWLPFVTCDYVTRCGDTGVLDESVHFLEGRVLNPGEESFYDLPSRSREKAPVYEHCKRAIQHALRLGRHGLPFMGSGDWNDGMNLAGAKGEGESIWLAFFLYAILRQFGPLARGHGDEAFSTACTTEADRLRLAIETAGWDGEWYLRAFCDDGTVLGTSRNSECRIDAVVQSWSVLSGAASAERAQQAMRSLEALLVDRKNGLIKLLDPPFDTSELEPGYIKGYVPGIRENGGQYTHAAVWAVMAFALLGDAPRVAELLAMINPVNHGATGALAQRYLVEPYVMAADIYGSVPHAGRGGWTWYTGSAAWMYRLIVDSVLGVNLKGETLSLVPCVPPDWDHFAIHYRFRETMYHLSFVRAQPGATMRVTVDGAAQDDGVVKLSDDRQEHFVEIVFGGLRSDLKK